MPNRYLQRRAERCREVARQVPDETLKAALLDLAKEYQLQADETARLAECAKRIRLSAVSGDAGRGGPDAALRAAESLEATG